LLSICWIFDFGDTLHCHSKLINNNQGCGQVFQNTR
jgi:hypothetical protein